MPPRKPKAPTPVEALKHKDKRVNIPTEELREFVRDEEEAPKTKLYPRDPSLDPQLVWKGKDEQDREDLAVPVVPIYIQEKIHPQALIENLRETAKAGEPEPELRLFDDFNGLKAFEQKIDFYSHDMGNQPKWSNRMILGDSLLVMTSLAEKEGLKGKVQMIYLDPPYGIKFGSNWQVSTRKRDVKDGKLEDATRQPEQVKAFRDTWKLGIHSYLAYLRDRLVAARELLTESGSIFVQIGDENVHLVRNLLDEVFGAENFFAQVNFRSMTALGQEGMASVYDYVLWYARDRVRARFRPLYQARPIGEEPEFTYQANDDGTYRKLTVDEISSLTPAQQLRVFKRSELRSSGFTPSCTFSFSFKGTLYTPAAGKSWRTHADGIRRLISASRLVALGSGVYFRQYHADFPVMQLENSWHDTAAGFSETKTYVVQTSDRLIQRCLLMTTDPGDLVLDPTCGSGTTAYVAEQWRRRWITIDTSRVALALARTRLIAAKYPHFLLIDSEEGRRREAEITGQLASGPEPFRAVGDVRKGFVYKRVSHITLKAIANNEEIDLIHARYEEKLAPLLARLRERLGETWREWEVPREPDPSWPADAREAHASWWSLRRERQREIDDSIARRADTEFLFDQPYEDPKRIRVTGPFTVESLSPHRVLAVDDERPAAEARADKGEGSGRFEPMILDNLRKAGVQNTRRDERLVLDRLEPFAGAWVQAAGEYTDAAGKVRRVAVSIGPENGTVGPHQIQEAAKEAVRGIPFDLLLVLGFAFDAHASDVAREISPAGLRIEEGFVAEHEEQYGKLPVLLVRMNPDLAMGDELLKKTGAGNLFMVFGEPDLAIAKQLDGKLVVEIRGLDVYDPTTGVIRNSTTDDIACWFIDTDYNGESFFVRHAYFTGADEPYDRLKRALRADIDEAAWATLYTTKSRPFDPPTTGKIAVKVINHYGDEVLKVYALGGGDS